jgi:hypothetical protein
MPDPTTDAPAPDYDPYAGMSTRGESDLDPMEALLMGLGGSSAPAGGAGVDGFEINFDELQVKMISEATYPARILSAEFGKSKAGGNNQITIEWMILEGEFAGRTLRSWVTFTEGNVRRVAQFFKAVMGDQAQGNKTVRPQDLLNRMAMIEVTHREYLGENRENVNNVLPYKGGVGRFWVAGAGLDTISPF